MKILSLWGFNRKSYFVFFEDFDGATLCINFQMKTRYWYSLQVHHGKKGLFQMSLQLPGLGPIF